MFYPRSRELNNQATVGPTVGCGGRSCAAWWWCDCLRAVPAAPCAGADLQQLLQRHALPAAAAVRRRPSSQPMIGAPPPPQSRARSAAPARPNGNTWRDGRACFQGRCSDRGAALRRGAGRQRTGCGEWRGGVGGARHTSASSTHAVAVLGRGAWERTPVSFFGAARFWDDHLHAQSASVCTALRQKSSQIRRGSAAPNLNHFGLQRFPPTGAPLLDDRRR